MYDSRMTRSRLLAKDATVEEFREKYNKVLERFDKR